MQDYIKPSGVRITVVDTEDTRALAKELGWKKPPGRKKTVTAEDE